MRAPCLQWLYRIIGRHAGSPVVGRQWWYLALVGGVTMALLAMPAAAEDIRQAMGEAYLTNPEIHAGRAGVRSADEGVPEALGGWRPTVTMSVATGRARDRIAAGSGQTEIVNRESREVVTGRLDVVQPLYRGGRTVAEVERAEAGVGQARNALYAIEQAVLLQAGTAFVDVYSARRILEIARQTVASLDKQYDIVLQRLEVRDLTRTDMAQTEARVARALDDMTQAQGSVEIGEARFARIVGRPLLGAPITPDLVLPIPESLDRALSLVDDNPRVREAVERVRAGAAAIDVAGSALMPSIQLRGSLRRQIEADRRDVERSTAEVLVELTVPLYQAGIPDAGVRARRHAAAQLQQELDSRRREAAERIGSAWQALQTSRARVLLVERQVNAADAALRGVEEEARVGMRSILDVLNAEQELFSARSNMVRVRRDEIVATLELSAAVGQLDVVRLELDVARYDPVPHYERTRDRIWGTEILPQAQ